MAWELASFPADLLGDVPALDGVDVEIVRRRRARARHPRARRGRASDPARRPRRLPDRRAGRRGPDEPPRRRRGPLVPRLPGRGAPAARAGVHRRPGRPRRGADAVLRGRPTSSSRSILAPASPTRSSSPGRGGRRSRSPRRSAGRHSTRSRPRWSDSSSLRRTRACRRLPRSSSSRTSGPLVLPVPVRGARRTGGPAPGGRPVRAPGRGGDLWASTTGPRLRNPTIAFQQNALVRSLYREHGHRLRFAGLVLMRGYEQTADDKQRAAEAAAAEAARLGADGVIVTTDAGGNSHTDVMLTVRACEQAGIRTHRRRGRDGRSRVHEPGLDRLGRRGRLDRLRRQRRGARPGVGPRARPRGGDAARRHARCRGRPCPRPQLPRCHEPDGSVGSDRDGVVSA